MPCISRFRYSEQGACAEESWHSHFIYPTKDEAKNKVGLEGKTVKSPSEDDSCTLQRM